MVYQDSDHEKKVKRNNEVTQTFQKLNTQELLKIWVENNHIAYLDEAFSAIEQILITRGISLPPQNPPTVRAKGLEALTESAKNRELKKWGIYYGVFGLIFLVFQYEQWPWILLFLAIGGLSFFLHHHIMYLLFGLWIAVGGALYLLFGSLDSLGIFLVIVQFFWAFFMFFKFIWYQLSESKRVEISQRFKK
jgi:hypothetical protein